MPEVELGDYQKVRLPYEFTAPGEEKLHQALEELQQMYGTTETVEHEIREGDYILLDLKSEKEVPDPHRFCDHGAQREPRA